MKLAPSLHRVGSDYVNCYLVDDSDGVTLIDAGLSGQWDDFLQELQVMGRSLGDVRGAMLTHGDSDHIGFAERLRREAGVPIYVHEADADRAQGKDKSNGSWGRVKIGPTTRFLWYGMRHGAFRNTPVAEVTTFTGGETLPLPGSPRIIHVPGHTQGSVAIHVPAVAAVFMGDALTTGHVLTGAKGPQPAPFTLEPEHAIDSLAALDDIQATWVLPGHGAPWDHGLAEALRLVRTAR